MKLIINEQKYKLLLESKVNNIISRVKQKIKDEGIGYKGKLYESDLQLIQELDQDELEEIYINYLNAITRKNRSAISLDKFIFIMQNYENYGFQINGNWIIGQYKNNFFRVSHFSPKTIRGGLETMKELLAYNNILLFVTEDLKNTIIKLGALSNENLVFPMIFRDMIVMKHFICTDEHILQKFLYHLGDDMEDFLNLDFDKIKRDKSSALDNYEKYY